MISFDEILNNMKNAYFNECQMYPDMNGRVGASLKAVASELCNLGVYADYVLKQSSWKTATGSYLDAIAAECSLQRRKGSRAYGTLTFFADESASTPIDIPAGTICCLDDKRYIQYTTVEKGTIDAGSTECSVKAKAMFNGEEYNAKGNEICVMVTPPSSVSRVTNTEDWSGGFDDESDEVLRNRIKSRLKHPARATNIDFQRDLIEQIGSVQSCNIVVQDDTVIAYVRTYSNTLDYETTDKINEVLAFYQLMGKRVNVELATPRVYRLSVIYSGKSELDEVEKSIREYCASLRVGDFISFYDMRAHLLSGGLNIKYLDISYDEKSKNKYKEYPVVELKEVKRNE